MENNKNILIVIDYFRPDMFTNANTSPKLDFFNSLEGKILYQFITKPRKGLGISFDKVSLTFAYPRVPSVNPNTDTFKPISATALKPYAKRLQEKIKQDSPDLVIGFGKTAHRAMAYSPNKSEYVIAKETNTDDVRHYKTKDYDIYHAYMPSLTKSTGMSIPAKDRFAILKNEIKRYLAKGPKGLEPELGEYEYFDNFSDVKNLFENILPKQKVVACDFETNTLKTWLPGAKAIMFSCSWKEHQGVSIPLDHKSAPNLWTKDQHNQIFKWITDLVSSKQFKIFHNSSFDIRMMMDIMGLQQATNVLDTMIFYYIAYSEEQLAKKGLKFLSKKYLTLGDYEKPRDKYFSEMQKHRYDYWYKAEKERLEKEAEETGKKVKLPKKKDYQKPINEVDGSDMNFEWLPLKILAPYASADTDATLQLFHIFAKPVLKNKKWTNLCYRWYPKLIDALCYMEHTGLHFDTKRAKTTYLEAYTKMKDELIDQMYQEVPEIKEYEQNNLDILIRREQVKKTKPKDRTPEQKELFEKGKKLMGTDTKGIEKYKFSPSSGVKVGYILYNMLGYELPAEKEYLKPASIKKKKLLSHGENITWEDYKVDSATALPYLVTEYDDKLAKLLMKYAEIDKILTSFVQSLPDLACDDYIHANFNVTGTKTTRLSSSNPNLQQQPKPVSDPNDPIYKYPIKGLYKSRFKGGYMFNFDYKSLEIFLSALISNETGLIQALMDGADVHTRNASIAFNTSVEEVTKQQRQSSKSVSFGLLYGQGTQGTAERLGVDIEEAQEIIDKVMSAMPKTKLYIEGVHSFAEKYGYVETMQGTRRRIPEAKYGNFFEKQRALRQSYNAIVQGSGPYVTNTAIIMIRNKIKQLNLKSRLVITVHDSIVVDVHPDEVMQVTRLVKNTMEHLPLSQFKISAKGYDVPDRWKLPNGQMRFPMFAEPEWGKSYADGLDWDEDEAKTFNSIEDYYNCSMESKRVNDIYASKLKNASDKDKEILEQEQLNKLQEIKNKFK